MDRRTFLSASVVAAAAPVVGVRSSAAAAQATSGAPAKPTRAERLAKAVAESRMALDYDGARFSGGGYDWLLRRGSTAQAFLLGEEHGIAENPKLAAQLFAALVPSGYRHVAIEISPPLAAAVDRELARGGRDAARTFLTTPESRVAFYGMREEAEFLAAARAALPRDRQVFWGLDYEIGADRYLIRQLQQRRKPAAAQSALDVLAAASTGSWARFAETKDPQFIYSFAGDPRLVQQLRAAWPAPDAEAVLIMDTLEQTFAINALWFAKKGYESNLVRSRFMRANLLRYWRGERVGNPPARVFMKFGASHMVRGASMSDVFDVGTLVPELVEQDGGATFHLLVLPGPGAKTANLDPTTFRYMPGKRDQYGEGMDVFDTSIVPGKMTLFDTAPLRPIASSYSGEVPLPLWRVIHGFDAVLIMTGSTPSTDL